MVTTSTKSLLPLFSSNERERKKKSTGTLHPCWPVAHYRGSQEEIHPHSLLTGAQRIWGQPPAEEVAVFASDFVCIRLVNFPTLAWGGTFYENKWEWSSKWVEEDRSLNCSPHLCPWPDVQTPGWRSVAETEVASSKPEALLQPDYITQPPLQPAVPLPFPI